MNILVVSGSPNTEGSTNTYANSVVTSAKNQGANVSVINIYDFKVTDVWADYFGDALANNFEKANDDDMPALKEKLAWADIIVLASPIYWYQLSGKLKTFVDRWTDTINPDFSSDLAGKGLALISTHSGVNVMNSSNYLQMAMSHTANFLGMNWLGAIDGGAKMDFTTGMNEGHHLIAQDFGEKLAKGKNLLGMDLMGQ